jgi:hypothetical protein
MKPTRCIALCTVLLTTAPLCWAAQSGSAPTPGFDFTWKQSLPLRSGDPTINAIGGTELRALATFDKKLFAAVGYWMDTERASPALPGGQVLRLDDADGQWQVDFELSDRAPSGMKEYLAVSTLRKVRFTLDQHRNPLAAPVEILLAGVWKRGVGLDALARTAGAGFHHWSRTTIPGQEQAPRGTQLRAFSLHKDRVIGDEIVFGGATNAIFVGKYDAQADRIAWSSQPEWQGEATRPSARARVASFAECNGKLYATASGAIYERSDGTAPAWKKVFETVVHLPGERVTGLRGLTCVHDSSNPTDFLLVGVEDAPSRIYRIDPNGTDPDGHYRSDLDLDVSSFLTNTLGERTTYAIVAYNDMTEYPDPVGACPRLLIGLESITPNASIWFGQQHFNPHAYYLLRDCRGSYALREIRDRQIEPEPQLVSTRTFALAPFTSDPSGAVYAGGFDANFNPVHNTAWLYRGVPNAR